MEEVVAWLRFNAREVYELLERVHERDLEELWLIRGRECYLQTPDFVDTVKPVMHQNLDLLTLSNCTSPRVEVLELHNHVLRTLCQLEDHKNVCVEIRYNEYDEYCLLLYRPPGRGKRSRRGRKHNVKLSWLSCVHDRRLF